MDSPLGNVVQLMAEASKPLKGIKNYEKYLSMTYYLYTQILSASTNNEVYILSGSRRVETSLLPLHSP